MYLQVKLKETEIKNLLTKMDNEIWKASKETKRITIDARRKQFGGLSLELLPIERSPVIEGYRNKCEFTGKFEMFCLKKLLCSPHDKKEKKATLSTFFRDKGTLEGAKTQGFCTRV